MSLRRFLTGASAPHANPATRPTVLTAWWTRPGRATPYGGFGQPYGEGDSPTAWRAALDALLMSLTALEAPRAVHLARIPASLTDDESYASTDEPWNDVSALPWVEPLLSLWHLRGPEDDSNREVWAIDGPLAKVALPIVLRWGAPRGWALVPGDRAAREAVEFCWRFGMPTRDARRESRVEALLQTQGFPLPLMRTGTRNSIVPPYAPYATTRAPEVTQLFWERCQVEDLVPLDRPVPEEDGDLNAPSLLTLACLVVYWRQYVKAEQLWRELCARAAPWGLPVQPSVHAVVQPLPGAGLASLEPDAQGERLDAAMIDPVDAALGERLLAEQREGVGHWTQFIVDGGYGANRPPGPLDVRALHVAALCAQMADPSTLGGLRFAWELRDARRGRRVIDVPNPLAPLWDLWKTGLVPGLQEETRGLVLQLPFWRER